jgi:uncharacterized protein
MVKPSSHRRRKKSDRWFGYILSFLLGVFLSVGGYVYLIQGERPSHEGFSQKASLAGQVIHSQLYEIGLSKKSILLERSALKKEGAISWEQSWMRIQIPRSLPFSAIEQNFRRRFSILGKPFYLRASQGAGSLQLEVAVMDRITHQITFLSPPSTTVKSGLRPQVAIVIDDLGGENHAFQQLLQLNLPLTFSILPFLPHSKTIAMEAHRKGREVILHLPMEPHDFPKARPGEGALLLGMDEKDLLRQLTKDIEAVPRIKGVSNHMGSRLMEDPEKMRIVLSELKRRGLFFLDNRTSPQSIGFQTARSIGLKATEKTLFLDHSQEEGDIQEKLEELFEHSLSADRAIGIGHPHPSTIKSLKEMIPRMREKGIDIVPVSFLME